jgi:multidrug efflux pump subunit AcrA (membrane-fusion protein)
MKILIILLVTFTACSSEKKSVEELIPPPNIVRLSPEVLTNLELQFEEARVEPLDEEIAATGRVIQDPDDVAFVFSNSPGIVRKIRVQVGETITKGAPLFQIGGQILRAPRAGTVISINVTEGRRVGPLQSLAGIADIDPIRVVFDVYPKDMDRVKVGQRAQVFLIGHEDEVFHGGVVYISPSLSSGSQSLKVGVDVENREGHLKYGMFVHGRILNRVSEGVLVIPEEALVSFDQEKAVFVQKGPDEFEKRPVSIGRRGLRKLEILSGLSAGEKVVTKGTFPLKSESLKHLMEEE